MLYKSTGIVLHQLRYSDTSLIVKILTEKFGVRSFMVKGVFRRRSPMSSGLFQHLVQLEIVVESREYGGLQHLREARVVFPYQSMHTDIRKSSVCLFINEILVRTLRHEEADPALYVFLRDALQWFDHAREGLSCFHLWFCVQLTSFLGFFPKPAGEEMTAFNVREGLFAAGNTEKSEDWLDAESTIAFRHLLQARIHDIPSLCFSREMRNQLTGKILLFYRWHLEDLGEIRSHQVLSRVFA